MDKLHLALLRIGFSAGDDLGLVLAGGYALGAHQLLDRPSQDIDFATASAIPLPDVCGRLAEAYRRAGFEVDVVEATPRMARLVVRRNDEVCEVDLLKEAIGPPTVMSIGPVLSFQDAVGLKMRALHDRAAHRDFLDIRAANARLAYRELESLGAAHAPHFSLEELADRLGSIDERDERRFRSYGLAADEIAELQRWARTWESDLRRRIAGGEADPQRARAADWDAYLDDE